VLQNGNLHGTNLVVSAFSQTLNITAKNVNSSDDWHRAQEVSQLFQKVYIARMLVCRSQFYKLSCKCWTDAAPC